MQPTTITLRSTERILQDQVLTDLELLEKYPTLLKKYGVTTPLRQAHLLAQLKHESNLKPISENLNYSAEGLLKIFKKYFPTLESAKAYARKPEKIANRAYANRMGNGDEASGDGWKYRGRGFIQLTGKANYKALTDFTGTDYISNPDLLLNEADAVIAALWFWKNISGNALADADDLLTISKRINGGTNGLEHRKELLAHFKVLLKCE